ncbi:MAG: class I tRNA ligase family protein, partial [Candidatus Vogelbacteria bacterium]|nr:class I tRNA ligase family protein [Candidatus Vogelbacteria bacterium]
GLIYEGYKSMHICPRCETTLSNFEVTQGYKDVTDISVTVKFELIDEPGTFVLAWTTTPWTLPGNVALAVGEEIKYVKIKIGDNFYILAKERLSQVKESFEEVGELNGRDLVGKKYKPVFDYYVNDEKLEHRENGWQIYGADFVTTEDGTGVVHIAPAFGDDDLALGRKYNLPFIQHVAMNGTFKSEVKDWPGVAVKPIENPQATDIEVLKNLAGKGLLFAKEKFTHSYPHCWRCETPLLNYATSSWFVKVTEFRDKLVAENKKINWVPEHVRDGRFGKWLEGARDWAISRTRFWGAPLPVWRCGACGVDRVFGSFDDLTKELGVSGNRYWAMRHGEADANINDTLSIDPADPNYLTIKGKDEVKESAQKLKQEKIDLIISSDFVRTKETTEILAEELNLRSEQIIFDERLREINPGGFAKGNWFDYNDSFGERINRLNGRPDHGGENYNDIRRRTMAVFYELDQKYKNKNILVVSHGLPLFYNG